MSLDTVELILAIEEEFGISIPDSDAAKLGLLGDIQDYIVSALQQREEAPDENRVWERLTAVVVRQLGVRPSEVRRTAHVVFDLGAD
jgi:acyl carrier protein